MRTLLLDTHAWAWSLTADPRLSAVVRRALGEAGAVHVSPISFFEIGQKVRLGKWPEMEPVSGQLPAILAEQGGFAAPLTPAICLRAALMGWSHRDPFDRLIAATALETGCPLLSADTAFDALAGRGLVRIW